MSLANILSQFAFCTHDKHQLEVKGGLFQLTGYGSSSIETRVGAQDTNLETGTETEAMEGCYLLTYFICLAQTAFLLPLKTTSPEMASVTVG